MLVNLGSRSVGLAAVSLFILLYIYPVHLFELHLDVVKTFIKRAVVCCYCNGPPVGLAIIWGRRVPSLDAHHDAQ